MSSVLRRARGFRLTFLWRFTLVTLAMSVLSGFVLAWRMEQTHRRAIETDIEVAAIGRLGAELTLPLDGLAAQGRLTPDLRRDFERIATDATRFEYVSAMRIYRPSGKAVYPLDAPDALDDVHAALAGDNFVRVERAGEISAYSPFYTRNEQVYVVAVDFSPGQLGSAYRREREQVFSVVAVVSIVSFISLIALAAGASRELELRRREAQTTFVKTLAVMADVIDLRDSYTAGHSKRVAQYSRKLATAIGLSEREVDVIENGALLHDIGKIGVPDAVLFKPGPLDPDERRAISVHPRVGARLLGGISAMDDVVPCVLHHHEKLDGTGYPDGLRGEEIPIGARVIAVADTFDAMTTTRPYRKGMDPSLAIIEMARVAGTQLDERLVMAFSALVLNGAIVAPPIANGAASHEAPAPVGFDHASMTRQPTASSAS